MIRNMTDISFVAPGSMPNKISAIKAIRTLTGLGLKESKDASERSNTRQSFPVVSHLSPAVCNEQIRLLQVEGFQIGPAVFAIIEELRKLGSEALLQGEDDLANDILQLVLAEKLRHGC
jgi:hypothetical protein